MGKLKRFLTSKPFLIVFVLSLPAIVALVHKGYYGASDDLHIAWLMEMDKLVKIGQIPPRFVPDLSYQFGYPLFNFVFPLPFYIAELFHLAGLTFVGSIKLLFALTIPVSGYFMYKLLEKYVIPALALAGGVIYMYTPYRSTDIYVRGAVGEALSFVFLPLAVMSLINIFSGKGRRAWVGIFGLSIAFLITSHNIMAYMFFPFLVLLAVMLFLGMRGTPLFLASKKRILFGFLLGILISAFFWFPAIVESRLMQYDTVFGFADHFPTLRQLVTPYFGYGASVPGPGDGMSFFIGVANLILVLVAIYGFFKLGRSIEKEQKILLLWAFFVFFVSVFMMNYRSSFLWSHLPLLPYFQFPWRFLSMTTFVTPIFIIFAGKLRSANYIGYALVAFAIILNFSYFKPHDFLERDDHYFRDRYIPEPSASDAYRQTSEEYLRLPKDTAVRPLNVYPRVSVKRGEFTEVILTNSLDAKFTVKSDVLALVSYNKYLFPGWQAKVDGQKVTLHAGRPFGQIYINLLPGEHTVEVYFRETPMRMILDIISLISLFTALGMIFIPRRKNVAESSGV